MWNTHSFILLGGGWTSDSEKFTKTKILKTTMETKGEEEVKLMYIEG